MKGYKCDFCGIFQPARDEPFAAIRVGDYRTFLVCGGVRENMGMTLDACERCWLERLEKPILNIQEDMREEDS